MCLRIITAPIEGGIVVTLQDITRESVLRDSLMDILRRLSHHLNTPLNAISGFSELLTTHKDRIVAEYARYILNGGQDLKRFVDDHLYLITLVNGKTDPLPQPLIV